jgi:hypothetical protein
MRTAATVLAVSAFAFLVLSAAVLAVAIALLPYVAIGCAIAVLIKSRRPPTVAARQAPYRCAPMPRSLPSAFASSGWVYVPVWVGPSRHAAMPVIDAEVVEDPR